MKVQMKVSKTFDKIANVQKAVNSLTNKAVYIVVPAEKAEREGPINNAELSYIHEFGAPANNLPARPHLRPGVERILPEAANELEDASKKALEGDLKAVDSAFERIGLAGQNSVQQMFVDNDWPALAESTLNYKPLVKDDQGNVVFNKKPVRDENGKVILDKDGKPKLEPKRKKSRLEQGKVNPLFVIGSLQKSHTYVVRARQSGND